MTILFRNIMYTCFKSCFLCNSSLLSRNWGGLFHGSISHFKLNPVYFSTKLGTQMSRGLPYMYYRSFSGKNKDIYIVEKSEAVLTTKPFHQRWLSNGMCSTYMVQHVVSNFFHNAKIEMYNANHYATIILVAPSSGFHGRGLEIDR